MKIRTKNHLKDQNGKKHDETRFFDAIKGILINITKRKPDSKK
jgi:hypothetical protein